MTVQRIISRLHFLDDVGSNSAGQSVMLFAIFVNDFLHRCLITITHKLMFPAAI